MRFQSDDDMSATQQASSAKIRPLFHGLMAAAFAYTLFYDWNGGGGVAPIPGYYLSKLVWLTMADVVGASFALFLEGSARFSCIFRSLISPIKTIIRGRLFKLVSAM